MALDCILATAQVGDLTEKYKAQCCDFFDKFNGFPDL